MSKDLNGNPLPEPWVTQESHDAVAHATELTEPPANASHAYHHWLASAWTLYYWNLTMVDQTRKLAERDAEIEQLKQELDACKNPPPPPPGDFEDGQGGALWKPISDNTLRPVILYPKQLTGKLKRNSGRILDSRGIKLHNMPFRTVANGDREHYDCPVPAGALPHNIIVEIETTNGIVDRRVVPVPTQRYD
jgi:hypothetical protein